MNEPNTTSKTTPMPDGPKEEDSSMESHSTERNANKSEYGSDGAQDSPVSLDLPNDTIKLDVGSSGFFSDTQRASDSGAAALQEELAEDMLDLMKKVSALDVKLSALVAVVMQLQASLEAATRVQGLEIEKLKEALISERKELIGRSTFNAVMPAIESLRFLEDMQAGRKALPQLTKQTQNLLDVLTGITQALGYRPVEVLNGEAFDPYTMECVGYVPGEQGKVVRMERSGYKAGNVMVRPCRVYLGQGAAVPPVSALGVKGAKA